MSGPKKADVEAQLNIARNVQRKCANLLADLEEATTATILSKVNSLLDQATTTITALRREHKALTGDFAHTAKALIAQAEQALDNARSALQQAHQKAAQAESLKQQANHTFAQGEHLYERAAESNRRLDPHYRQPEMEWAKQAQALFEQAASELAQAAQARRKAERAAVEALRLAGQAVATAISSHQHIQALQAEAEARRRAEEEARRIAEQQKREAALALAQAHAAFNRLATLPHDKFCPGKADRIKRSLDAADQAMAAGQFTEATSIARQIPEAVGQLEQEVIQAQQAFERRRAEAEAEISALAAAIGSADAQLVAQWSDEPQALAQAQSALQAAQHAVAAEDFAAAAQQAQAARQALAQALNSAAENRSADEKRRFIGQAIMDALTELGFQVSFEPGSRTEPLRIAGQTADEQGRGDFDIALPLEGEVDFEVNAPAGDTTCVAAVQELQKRLAERGIRWETTDWGHAKGAVDRSTTVEHKPRNREEQAQHPSRSHQVSQRSPGHSGH
jgi:hypothetical protein